jgi:hypothetical protein
MCDTRRHPQHGGVTAVEARDTVHRVSVTWPDRRADVISGLDALASDPPVLQSGQSDPRWPDLTNAVHWVVDDTSWDTQDPAKDVGLILRDEGEAAAVRAVVTLVVGISERRGPLAPDALWFADPEWPGVRQVALAALELMQNNDRRS